MFNNKNTIIIMLLVILVFSSISLNALLRVEVWNVYSRSWGHDSVTFEAISQQNGYSVNRSSGSVYNLTPAMVYWNGIALGAGNHDYTVEQDTRGVTGVVNGYDTLLKVTLPGQWEPIPDDPPDPD